MNAEDWMMIIGHGVGERDIMTYIRNKKEKQKKNKRMTLEKDSLYIASIIRYRHYILCAFMALPRFISFTSSQSQSLFRIESTKKNKEGGIEKKFAPLHRKNLLDPNFFVPFTLFYCLHCFISSLVCISFQFYCLLFSLFYVNQHDMYTINLLRRWVWEGESICKCKKMACICFHIRKFSSIFSFFLHIP